MAILIWQLLFDLNIAENDLQRILQVLLIVQNIYLKNAFILKFSSLTLSNVYNFWTNLVQVTCFRLTCRCSKEPVKMHCAIACASNFQETSSIPVRLDFRSCSWMFPSGRSDDPCIIQMRSELDLWRRAHSSNVRPLRAHWPERLEWCVQSLFCRGGCMRRCAQPMRTDRGRRDEFYGATWKNECTKQERRFCLCDWIIERDKERERGSETAGFCKLKTFYDLIFGVKQTCRTLFSHLLLQFHSYL